MHVQDGANLRIQFHLLISVTFSKHFDYIQNVLCMCRNIDEAFSKVVLVYSDWFTSSIYLYYVDHFWFSLFLLPLFIQYKTAILMCPLVCHLIQ
mmetsp:Transcript_6364/g.9646  ORF Transcript_6364/g.9646 Transcript_6364/m.9646 type:complete len:94 (-) Transcript_6364:1019-1300(-)